MRNIPYHKAVGSLMYTMLGTRPDICFVVQTVSHFNSKPGLPHWEAIKRIFRYLIGTKDLWLGYGGQDTELVGYGDAEGVWQRIGRQYLDTHSSSMEGPSPGVQNVKKSFFDLQPKANILLLHTVAQKTAPMFAYYIETHVLLNADII